MKKAIQWTKRLWIYNLSKSMSKLLFRMIHGILFLIGALILWIFGKRTKFVIQILIIIASLMLGGVVMICMGWTFSSSSTMIVEVLAFLIVFGEILYVVIKEIVDNMLK